ncbi:hypothetical protein AREALGSMS7_01315 [Arenibacter algicola]|uniref:Uncharacterized protein n=1 Tax=Arenibacter algicola TaxID=616991 RepID=A0A221UUB3_9FLAO|nr:hypothetical protein AREALGSMS7_01315 [Arenibacter algicola]
MGISSHIKLYETMFRLTHNQVVPGSSPGGTTSSRKPTPIAWVFHFLEVSWVCPSFQQEMKKMVRDSEALFSICISGHYWSTSTAS